MNCFLGIPVEVGAAIMLLIGALLGGLANAAAAALSFERRGCGPWIRPLPEAPPRRWYDRVPVLGWITLRRERSLHGSWFWLRPLTVEVAAAVGLAWLYRWEMTGGYWVRFGVTPPATWAEAQYLAHVALIWLMLVATLTDLDEQLIPAQLTLWGTLGGLALAAALPVMGPFELVPGQIVGLIRPLTLSSPADWSAWCDGQRGLEIGLLCMLAWCAADFPRERLILSTRRGWRRGIGLFLASFWRRGWPWLALAAGGGAAVAFFWWWGGPHWMRLLTALVGMAFSGGLIWAIRVTGQLALRKEAMGFGDVMLMAMIGVFLGWQSSIMILIMSAFLAIGFAVLNLIIHRSTYIAFGPYLCMAALILLLVWPTIWEDIGKMYFALANLLIYMLILCFVPMGGMLWFWRLLSDRWFGRDEDEELATREATNGNDA